MTLGVQKKFLVNCMYPDFPVCSGNVCMPVSGLEDYFLLQILQKLFGIT